MGNYCTVFGWIASRDVKCGNIGNVIIRMRSIWLIGQVAQNMTRCTNCIRAKLMLRQHVQQKAKASSSVCIDKIHTTGDCGTGIVCALRKSGKTWWVQERSGHVLLREGKTPEEG